ncbi:glycoside hydrolase superfamily, partial [Catenaria anguillulae PL171]
MASRLHLVAVIGVLVTLLFVTVPILVIASPCPGCPIQAGRSSRVGAASTTTCRVHTVASGEYCFLIAQRYGLTLNQLLQFNPGLVCNPLMIGTRLCVSPGVLPPLSTTRTTTSARSTATSSIRTTSSSSSTRPTSTTSSTSSRTSTVTVTPTTTSRSTTTSSTLAPTPTPQIPTGNPDGTCKEYTVVAGDYCWILNERCANGISREAFNAVNPGLNCNPLAVGQRVCCSSGRLGMGSSTSAPAPTTSSTTSSRPPTTTSSSSTSVPTPTSVPPSSPCATTVVQPGDTCASISSRTGVSSDNLVRFNLGKTWLFSGCNALLAGSRICISEGTSPLPPSNPALECGMESVGNKTCPLNTCCSRFGYCGTTADFCTADPAGVLGRGCQSNCGLTPPPEAYRCNDGVMRYSVGYYESWAEGRACHAVRVEDLDVATYTHLIYSFAVIDAQFGLALESAAQVSQLQRFVAHVKQSNPLTKAVIAVGGWSFNDPGPTQFRFSDMISSASTRSTFIQSALRFLQLYQLDGLDIDFEYPVAPERGGRPQDLDNYLYLVRELRQAFGSRYSLSIAAPAGYYYLKGFRIGEMASYLDYVMSMTYDLHGAFDFGASSVMMSHTNISDVRAAVNLALKAGVPSNKFVMGLAFYGRSFRQASPTCSRPGCAFANPALGVAEPGRCTREAGIISYREIDEIVRSGAARDNFFDEGSWSQITTYGAYSWVAYDTPESVRRRLGYAREQCLGGSGVWAVDLDSASGGLAGAIRQARARRRR